jgi:hypothetical protein
MVIGALLAFSTWLGAAPIGAENRDSDSAIGVAVPGLTVTTVSGEAFGGEAEIEITSNVTVRPSASAAAEAGGFDITALFDAVRTGDLTPFHDLLQSEGVAAAAAGAQHFEVGPEPDVELPSDGGVRKESEDSLDLDVKGVKLPLAEDLHVETEGAIGDTGFARTEVDTEDTGGFTFFAKKLDTECRADLAGVEASTTIDDGRQLDESGTNIVDMPEHPDENEVLLDVTLEEVASPSLTIRVTAFLIANEQDDDPNAITVNGAREHFRVDFIDTLAPIAPTEFADFKATFAHAHCDVHPDPVVQVVEPTFTG